MIIKKAEIEDIKNVFETSNEDEVRRFSINKSKIEWNEHVFWYKNILENKNAAFYVFYEEGIFYGQVRFLKDMGNATISISLSKNSRGLGLGKLALKMAIEKYISETEGLEKITALIMQENIPSRKVFEKSNFVYKSEENIDGSLFLRYELEFNLNSASKNLVCL